MFLSSTRFHVSSFMAYLVNRRVKRKVFILGVGFGFLSLFSSPSFAHWHNAQEAIMGTTITVELWSDEHFDGQAAVAAVIEEMRRVDRKFSPYIESSELSKINSSAFNRPVVLSGEMFDLLSRAIELSVLTDGAFDISFASVGKHYDYRKKKKPTSEQLNALLPAVNYRHLELNSELKSVQFTHKNVSIDLGGIAKGHAVDRAIALLESMGVQHATVSAGGDSRMLGDKHGEPWLTGIKHPRSKKSATELATIIPLSDVAVSTSGDYERYFEEDGQRYHHILSPKTGTSAGGLTSVSIIGNDATTTDGLSTAVFVMGLQRGLALINSNASLDAIIIDNNGRLHFSSGLLKAGE